MKDTARTICLWFMALLLSGTGTDAFNPIAAAATLARPPQEQTNGLAKSNNELPVDRVAVVGATGRLGRYVVQELLDRGVKEVVAVVRSETKAQEVLAAANDDDDVRLNIVECDLTSQASISQALQGMEAAVWCATGFSSETTLVDRVKNLVGLATKQSIDLVGLPVVAETIAKQNDSSGDDSAPRVVMCSSAGVTRPTWSDEKKAMLKGAADIPIVRLNPFGILDIKRQSEDMLRAMKNVPYAIVRPAGLNDRDWPAGSRPILSQGDVAVGRIHRRDVAGLLVDVLAQPAATGKTFEVIALANYPKGDTAALTTSLQRMSTDADLAEQELPLATVEATYATMQQLLPGEKQDAAALAMGQTYEQLDKGQTGRLGERGQEDALAAAPQPTNQS